MARLVRRCAWVAAALVAAVNLAAPALLNAQYFGQNKVQYQNFDFHILRTPHFDIYYYPRGVGGALTPRAWRSAGTRGSRGAGPRVRGAPAGDPLRQRPDFQQTRCSQGEIGEGTGGVTEVFKQRVMLPFAGPYEETDHVLGHELVHAFQYDIPALAAGRRAAGGAARFNAPLWFIEGMAEYLSIGPVDPQHRHVDARRRAHRHAAQPGPARSTTRASSPTAGGRRCGRTWAGAGATPRWGRSSSR